MTISQLEYIIALDHYRHFVTASEKCSVTQPTLSMQIKKLEESLGVLIFDRNKQPIEPTEIGKTIIEQAKVIVNEKQHIVDYINNTKNNIAGRVRIGIIPTISTYLVHRFISKMVEKYPKLNIEIEELKTEEIVEQLKYGQIDLGILATPLHEEVIKAHPLYYESFALYVSSDHELYQKEVVSSYDINRNELWLLSDGNCFRNHAINLCNEEQTIPKKLKFGYKTSNLDVLINFVDMHYGYTLLPYLATLDLSDEQKKHIRHFKHPAPKREISIVTAEGFLRQKLLDALIVEIQENIPEELIHLDNGKIINWK